MGLSVITAFTGSGFSVVVIFLEIIFSGVAVFIGAVDFIFTLIGAVLVLVVFTSAAGTSIAFSSSHTGSGVGSCFANSGSAFLETEGL